MSDMVPEGWEKKRLSDFSTARRGTTYVSSELSEDKERFPLYINMKSFKVGGGYSENGDKYFTSPYSPNQLVQDNDLLIANTDVTDSCDILGAPAYVPREKLKNDVLFSHHISALNISDDVSLDFLNFLMCSEHIRLEMKRYGRGTTVKMLDMRDIGKISLSIPPLPEQKKIASILTSVDEVIEKTQLQINKLQDLKKATMNELLTRGIGHTEFKDSELGRIPKSWEVLPTNQLYEFKNGLNKEKEAFGSGQRIVNYMDVYNQAVITEDDLSGRVELSGSEIQRFSVHSNDLFFTRTSETPSEIGLSSVIKNVTQDTCFSGFILRARACTDKIFPKLSGYIYRCNYARVQIVQTCSYTTRALTNGTSLGEVMIAIPSLSEQEKIYSILDDMEKNIINKKIINHKYKSLKKSLMQDLLTGKVRVTVN